MTLIRSFADISVACDRIRPVVTLFSGGLDSTYLLYRLQTLGFSNVHALAVNIGDEEDEATKRLIAAHFGATLHLVDGRDDFVAEFVSPAILAHATYLDTHPISSSLSRPLIAGYAVDLAVKLDAELVIHTANRSQNTLRRLNGALRDLGYAGGYGSPYDLDPVDREVKLAELRSVGLDLLGSRGVSGDSNLWCREYESGFLDDPECHDLSAVQFDWTGRPLSSGASVLTVEVESGIPTAVDGERLPLRALIERLNVTVGAYGLGRYTGLEHLPGGEKVLEVREMPAAWLIFKTLRHLETACLHAEVIRERLAIEQIWVREALEGRWFQPLRRAAQSFLAETALPVSGRVVWNLAPAGAETTSIVARNPLYLRDREQWERENIDAERRPFLLASLPGSRLEGSGIVR